MIKNILNRVHSNGILGTIAMIVYRMGNIIHYKVKIPIVRQILWFIYRIFDLVFVKIIARVDISALCKVGSNLRLPHGGNGVIINGETVIGNGVCIHQQVTIGNVNNKKGSPSIGNDVFIGAGARVLGPIKIGDYAKIGANAVVLQDVPEGATAVGVPARIIIKRVDITE